VPARRKAPQQTRSPTPAPQRANPSRGDSLCCRPSVRLRYCTVTPLLGVAEFLLSIHTSTASPKRQAAVAQTHQRTVGQRLDLRQTASSVVRQTAL
jgi:hypothetical protein